MKNKILFSWVCFVWVVGSGGLNVHANEELPKPTMAMPDTTLWLEVVVNGKPSGQVIAVNYHDKHYWLTAEQLNDVGLAMLNPKGQHTVAIDTLQDINVNYQSDLQQLLIDLPSSWLPEQRFVINKTSYPQVEAESSLGALMNYDIYVTSPEEKQAADTASLWTEQRAFDGFGVISNTGIYRKSFSGSDYDSQSNRYLRYDTQWKYSDEHSMVSYSFGDVITSALPWSSAVRMGGLQIARNFATRPDLITYPLPQFAGSAAIPSTVDLYINNYKMDTQAIAPGPFTLETQPYINGAGSATVVTTDALGRRVSTSVPFYVASTLLGKGLSDYSGSLGILRRDYGIKSADYSDAAGSGLARYGLTDWLTVEGRAEGAQHLYSTGVGTGIQVSNLGVLNLSVSGSKTNDKAWQKTIKQQQIIYDPVTGLYDYDDTYSQYNQHKNTGKQTAAGYSYNNQYFSVNAQRTVRSKGYADLSTYRSNYLLSRRQDQLTASIGMGKLGTLGSGYFAIRNAQGGETRLLNISWNTTVWRNINLYASMNKEIGGQGVSAQFMFTVPLDEWGTASISSNRDTDNHWVTRSNWSRTVPTDGGLGWNLAYAHGSREADRYKQADLTWRSDYFETRGGIYGTSHSYTRWGEMTGALVGMNGGVYATNTISDSFALVSTSGFDDVPVYYENQLIGETNNKGYKLVPNVTAWYPTKLSIDTLALPADIDIPTTNKELSVRERSGLLVDFNIKHIKSVNFVVVDSANKPIAKGSEITANNGEKSWVGWDGLVWMQNLPTNTTLTIVLADTGSVCHINLALPKQKGIVYLDQQICR